jgi:hypothetical protein
MAGGPIIYGTTGTTSATSISDILATLYRDKIISQIQRACVLPQLLPVRPGTGKNIAWDVAFTNASGYTNGGVADGATISTQNSDVKVPAVLQYTSYVESFGVGGRAQAAAMATGNPMALVNLLGYEAMEATRRLASKLSVDFYTGTGASNQLQGLYSTTGSTYGALIATGTYAGVSRSDYSEWACNVEAGSSINRELDFNIMREMRRLIYAASGEKPDLVITDTIQFAKFGRLFGPNVRYNKDVYIRGEKVTLEGGYTALDFDGIPVIEDVNHPAGKMSFLNTNHCYISQLPYAPEMADGGGDMMLAGSPEEQFGEGNIKLSAKIIPLARSGDYKNFELVTYPQIVVDRPNTCGSLTYLAS